MYYLFGNSGNAILNKFIFEKRLKWIPHDKLKNIKYLDKGGFGTVYKAIWLNEKQNKEVVLKCLNNLNENLNVFLNEWKYHESCLNSPDIIDYYGFTKDPDTLNYIVIMNYANKGNLRGNLTKVVKYNWKQKLFMLYKIISGIYEMHNQKLIHCDLHDDLMKKCWDENPLKRPSASEVKYAIGNWIFRPDYFSYELQENIKEFMDAPIEHNNLANESHSQACYTSRLLDFTSGKLNEIIANEDLDDCKI
ncbi:uncharacterized protein OCT59_015917 [Rhizophagus irregularis]|uniref:uncharacterized protein n=1 Tax=Rhizophagus irregularis TaxID=588596 RepID=UPI003325C33C|nr:hypothetical protein OCT59_015917 [Rhizophagus irregularis]